MAPITSTNGSEFEAARWEGVIRPYSPDEVQKIRGSIKIEYSLADMGARKLWSLMKSEPYVHSLGAMTGNQASLPPPPLPSSGYTDIFWLLFGFQPFDQNCISCINLVALEGHGVVSFPRLAYRLVMVFCR